MLTFGVGILVFPNDLVLLECLHGVEHAVIVLAHQVDLAEGAPANHFENGEVLETDFAARIAVVVHQLRQLTTGVLIAVRLIKT